MDLCCCFCPGPPDGRLFFISRIFIILDFVSVNFGDATAGIIKAELNFVHYTCHLRTVPHSFCIVLKDCR